MNRPNDTGSLDSRERQPFSDDERRTLAGLVERIFPTTEDWPGAVDIGVVDYLVRQLATGWGASTDMYRDAPFSSPLDSGHGWQSEMTRKETYHYCLAELDNCCEQLYGRLFAELNTHVQEEVMRSMEADTLPGFAAFPSSEFFTMLRECVLEGLFADPVYGGNRDMLGWRWLRYPGCQPAYGVNYADYAGSTEPYQPQPLPLLVKGSP